MKTKNDIAISSIVVAVIVIIIIAGAAGAYYFVSTSGQTSSSTSTSHTSSSTSHTSSSTSSMTTTSTSESTSSSTSTSQMSSSTSSQSSTSSVTCTTTSGTSTLSIQDEVMQIVPLFQTLSAMTMNYSGSSGGTPFSMQMSYKVVSKSTSGGVTTYLVDFTERVSSIEVNASAKFQSNGNILWVYEMMNFTGSAAENMFLSLGAPFLVETTVTAQLQLYTSSQFTITGTPIKNFGPTSMQVTDYSAVALPLTISSCGFTETITAFSLEVGTVPGTSLELITQMHLVATMQSTSTDFTIQVTSITKA